MKNYRIHMAVLAWVLCGVSFVTSGAAAQNPNKIAILKWHGANRTASFHGCEQSIPSCVAFDGANIWVANSAFNTVSRMRPSDGGILGAYTVGSSPQRLAFDGAHIWVANGSSGNVTKLRASPGATVGTYAVGRKPLNAVFDGTSPWVSNFGGNSVTKLAMSNEAVLGTYPVGN